MIRLTDNVGDMSSEDYLKPIVDEINENKTLNESQKEIVRKMIEKRSKCFSKNKSDLGFCSLLKHRIDVKPNVQAQQTYHRLPIGMESRVENEIEELLKKGIIRESNSSWNSPIVVVRKPNSKDLRICLNYRKLNNVTMRPTYYIPDSAQIFDSLEGAQYFSTIDLSNAYYQCEIEEDHKQYTAFNTRMGKFEFNRMPFGLCGAPFTFQNMMSVVLKEENWKTCVIYLDDILIYSNNLEDHLHNVRTVLEKIENAGLKLSPKKCHFFTDQVKFLGHTISKEGLQTDPDKISKIRNWPIPKTIADLRSFLGFCNYYRKFMHGYANIAASLERALSGLDKRKSEKTMTIDWSNEMTNSFNELKMKLCSPLILTLPKPNCQFILDTDASFYGIGAILSQIQGNEERVIAYASRRLTKHEQSYCITRKELLSVFYFTKYFRQYLLGRNFKIRTDHKALTWLMNWKEPNTTQFCHWIAELEVYDFTIEHRKGTDHVNADFMSRITDCEQCEIKHVDPKKKRNVKIELFPRANMIKLDSNSKGYDKKILLQQYHDDLGHIGITKMTELMLRNYSWTNIRNDIQEYVNNCHSCAQRKISIAKGRPMLHITATKPLEKIMIDIAGPLTASRNGYRYILGIIDVYTRFVMLIPIRSLESSAIIKILKSRWIPLFGTPDIVVSDSAYNLNSSLLNDMLDEYGIQKVSTSPYHSQSNGIIERTFRTVKDMVFSTINQYGIDWVEALPLVEIGIRSSKHSQLKISPYEALFGKMPNLPQFIPENYNLENLDMGQYLKELERRRKRIDNKLKGINKEKDNKSMINLFKIGDLVMVKCLPKIKLGVSEPRYEGPGHIVKIVDKKSYVINLQGKLFRRHEDSLKLFKGKLYGNKENIGQSVSSENTLGKKLS